MESFFNKKETQSNTRPDGKTYSCVSCGLYRKCKNPKLKPTGNFKKGILNLAAFPTKFDDRKIKHFQDRSGKYLQRIYKGLGIDIEEDCLNYYAVNCHTSKVMPFQIECCRKSVMALIEKYKPKIIICFGMEGLYGLIGHRWKKKLGGIYKWRGFQIPDQELKTWICPVFSPLFVADAKNKVEEVIWKSDLKKALQKLDESFYISKTPKIVNLGEDLQKFDEITEGTIAFDYETTGIKPHRIGHKVVCGAVAVSEDLVYTFMMPATKRARKPWYDLMQRESVKKIAQNLKFEDNWTNVRLRSEIKGWEWDTMLATHIIDNRPGITGLKFQTYVQFGIIDYDFEVSPWLKSKGKDANEMNKILELIEKPNGQDLLLKYCAYDSIYEFRLAMRQQKVITKIQPKGSMYSSNITDAYALFHKGTLAFAKAERQGLRIDVEYTKGKEKKLEKLITRIESKLFDTNFYKHWKHTRGGKAILLNSDMQLRNYLYGVKKLKPPKLTKTGLGAVDEDALKMLKIPELDMLVERSKLMKIKDTYLGAFMREQVNTILHPSFDLNNAITYRSSSSNPNFQNIPKRDKKSMQIVRGAIYPRKDHQLMELDYSGIEVAIAACYHKDPTMLKYINDPNSDMHGDMARQIFMVSDFDRGKQTHNKLRAATKNSFVFPQFYGSWYMNCAADFCGNWLELPQADWKKTDGVPFGGSTIGSHFIKNGINSFSKFCRHLQKIEKHFWTRRFPEYAKWKETHYAVYQKYGYISLKTGFVCSGVMAKNDVINYPIQGAAFHCLLWLFTTLQKEMEKGCMQSKLVGQIHDAIVIDVHPNELYEVNTLARYIGEVLIKEAFPWIIVPLTLEAELCPIDRSWAEKEDWNPEQPIYYYYHESSDGLYTSPNPPEIEFLCGEELVLLTEKEARWKEKKLGIKIKNPHDSITI